MKKTLLVLFTFLSLSCGFAFQMQLSSEAEISVLTFGPGGSLNDAFGHSAFRVQDKSKGLDVVYGYGTYDFDAPNFYLKFVRGKLNYLISKNTFSNIYRNYSGYNRSIKEQVLNLNSEEKQNLYRLLEENYKPQNRRYLYDFFYENCATRIRDLSEKATDNPIQFEPPVNFKEKSFRGLIHEHIAHNSWGSLGIDIALGSVVDKQAAPYEYMFLPKYIHAFFEVAKINHNQNLVKRSTTLFKNQPEHRVSNLIYSPFFILGFVALFLIYLTYKDYKTKRRTRWIDLGLFTITGSIGVLVLLLWFATDHGATAQNYNLLWAVPLNLLLIKQLYTSKIKTWFLSYIKFLILMLCLLCLHWIIGVQIFAIGLIPLLIAMMIRYIYLVKYYSH